MHILVSGATGFVGSALLPLLQAQGHSLLRLSRSAASGADTVHWDPETGVLDPSALKGIEAVVHLAGDPIAKGRWTKEKKRRIRDSRVKGTHLLAQAVAGLTPHPQVMICASAIGYYGSRGDEVLREESHPGVGFLAETGRAWEEAARPAAEAGIRVVNLRFGIILHPSGGALRMMLPPFQMGLGGPLGNGRQWMSWISREDVVGIILYALSNPALQGPVNAVSPHPVTNLEFSKTLGKVLRRPVLFPVPGFAVRLLFGEMGDEALLASTRVIPHKLQQAGYSFRHPTLEEALAASLRG